MLVVIMMRKMMKTTAIVSMIPSKMEVRARARDPAMVTIILGIKTRSMTTSTTNGPSLARARVVAAAGTASPANRPK